MAAGGGNKVRVEALNQVIGLMKSESVSQQTEYLIVKVLNKLVSEKSMEMGVAGRVRELVNVANRKLGN